MNKPPEIKDLPQLLQLYLDDSQVVSYTSRYLTKPGDNYGSLMISLTIKVQKPNGDIEDLPLIAKLPPITNDFFWKMFQPEHTSLVEIAVYKYLRSEIRKFQLEAGVKEADLLDVFGKYYGSRASLDPNSEKVDRDAVLLMENLQTSGYKAGNRHRMFDLDETRLVITELAKFHALPIALRLKRPEVYEKKIYPYFQRFDFFKTITEEEKIFMTEAPLKEVELITNNNEDLIDRVKKLMQRYNETMSSTDIPNSSYVSISHGDLWMNNIMLKYDEFGRPIKVKFVDYQLTLFDTIFSDIIFFLFVSVDTDVLEKNYYKLLELYYEEFIKCLESVDVSTEKYSYLNFLDEVHSFGSFQIWHAMFMARIILADTKSIPDNYEDFNQDVMAKNVGGANGIAKMKDIIRLAQKFKFL